MARGSVFSERFLAAVLVCAPLALNGCVEPSCEETLTCPRLPGQAGREGAHGGVGGEAASGTGPGSGRGGTGAAGTHQSEAGEAGTQALGAGEGGTATAYGGKQGSGGSGGISGRPNDLAGQGGTGAEGSGASTTGAGGEGGSDGPPVCGKGRVEGDEVCDDGEDNGLGAYRCAPNCSTVIEIKHIVIGSQMGEDMSPDPIASVDSSCPSGYKALFAYGTERRATTVPFKSVNPIDWVLRPYTYYYNHYENPIWLTREVAMLGIDNGEFVGLENSVSGPTYVVVSNLNIDGTTLGADNCNNWHSDSSSSVKQYGLPLSVTNEEYLVSSDTMPCGYAVAVYCVEQ